MEASDHELSLFAKNLGLPEDFGDRARRFTEPVETLVRLHDTEVTSRRFVTGLFIAFIAFAEDLLGQIEQPSLPNALDAYPPLTQDNRGRRLNTLTVQGPFRQVGLRGYYNRAERVILSDIQRFDYPNMAPHATQAWTQHRDALETIFALSPDERAALAESLWKFLLTLPAAVPRTLEGFEPRPFAVLLSEFPNTQRGEPAGALLQGLAFAYYRADAPNVTLESAKVGAGSARTGRVGDIDGWSGDQLALSVEVKDRDIDISDINGLAPFFKNLSAFPNATAIILARSFTTEAKDELRQRNVLVLDRSAMAGNVRLWDLRKQQLALREFDYFLFRIQRSNPLRSRFHAFLDERGLQIQ